MVVGACQSVQPGLLEIIEVCLNLGIRFCIAFWLVLLNLNKISL